MTGYPGAKSGAGVYQAIINEFPPHRVYVEAFAGSGAILRRKRPAEASIVIERDEVLARRWQDEARSSGSLTAIHGDARSIIAGLGERIRPDWLIYCDPPYVRSARRSGAKIYRHEFTDEDHAQLLSLLLTVSAPVAISGYRCPMYDDMLASWRRVDFVAMTRRGRAIESLWCNYPRVALAEYTYLGENYRERERIKRKRDRWRRRLAAMPPLERAALMAAMADVASTTAAPDEARGAA